MIGRLAVLAVNAMKPRLTILILIAEASVSCAVNDVGTNEVIELQLGDK